MKTRYVDFLLTATARGMNLESMDLECILNYGRHFVDCLDLYMRKCGFHMDPVFLKDRLMESIEFMTYINRIMGKRFMMINYRLKPDRDSYDKSVEIMGRHLEVEL